jgi:hypothetical protein
MAQRAFAVGNVRRGRSVGIVRSRTKCHGVCFLFVFECPSFEVVAKQRR